VCRSILSCALLLGATGAAAQEPVSIGAEFLFYGDNTEFSNPFREGETLLGNSGQLVLDTSVGGRARMRGGVFGDHRFGSSSAFEIVRPVFSLELHAGASTFVFGTLQTAPQPAFGPDRAGPHRLLPPIQRETLAFTRPYEAGLQWIYRTSRVSQDCWLDWQRLNTPHGREVFDGGLVGQVAMSRRVSLAYQWHIVHHGGQLFASGPVGDSWVVAPGAIFESPLGERRKLTFESYALVSRHVPNRERLDRSTSGAALFARGAIEHGEWRGHLIVWRGNDYIKEEGDANYGGLRLDGRRYRKVRDYAEIGVTRVARPVPQLDLEGSARVHRIENHYEYSYRILGRVAMTWRLR
jgi:hypothetical protein